MKKLLLCGTALLGVALMSTPASAQIQLGLSGEYKGYAVFADHDDDFFSAGQGANLHDFDFRRNSEIRFSGETTLDNGLTVGVHSEMKLDAENGAEQMDEMYSYFSGSWGRVNFGTEDGAAYLLQVAAPSADSNIDGMRPFIQAFAVGFDFDGSTTIEADETIDLGYDNAPFRQSDRLTYLTPKFNGFQAGVSYAPRDNFGTVGEGVSGMASDNDNDEFENLWEASVRYDGEFSGVGMSLGAGYTTADLEANGGFFTDDATTWNLGATVSWNSFSLGAAYLDEDYEATSDLDATTWVVGAGWDNGPYHVGVSYYNADLEIAGADAIDGDRWTAGAGYTFGPGMSFRGSIARVNADTVPLGGTDEDATQVAVGTNIEF